MTYEDECREAATEQGLDPAVAELKAAGFPVIVEQTGGFCMVATIYGRDGSWVGITDMGGDEDDYDDEGDHKYMVCHYDADPEDEGTMLVSHSPLCDLPDWVAHALPEFHSLVAS